MPTSQLSHFGHVHYKTPTTTFLSQLPKYLLYLDLSQNKLASLQPLEHLTYLVYLNVSGNRLTILNGIQHCRQLRELAADHNRVSDVTSLAGVCPPCTRPVSNVTSVYQAVACNHFILNFSASNLQLPIQNCHKFNLDTLSPP